MPASSCSSSRPIETLLKHSRLPYTVGLFAIGIILGVMNRTGVFQSLPELHDAVSSVAMS